MKQWKPKVKLPRGQICRGLNKRDTKICREKWNMTYRFVKCSKCKKEFKRNIQGKGYNPLPHICDNCFEDLTRIYV